MTPLHTIQYVEVDTDPVISFYDQQSRNPAYRDLPDRFATALSDLINNPDARACANCDKGVGYVLTEFETDQGTHEQLHWHWATLIGKPPTYYPEAKGEPGGPIALLCEDCTTPLSIKALL